MPNRKHLPGATAKQQRQYEDILKAARKSGRYKGREKEVAARTVRAMAKRNPKSKAKSALRTTSRALKSAAMGVLSAGSDILGAGASALNPARRLKVRNKYIDLVIRGYAKKTPQGWQVGSGRNSKTVAQGRGTAKLSSGYYLDKATGAVYAKRERNIAQGFYDASGFHPIRASEDYDPATAGETGRKSKTTRSRKKLASKKKAASTARTRSAVKSRKATTSRLAGRSLKRSAGMLKTRNAAEFYGNVFAFHKATKQWHKVPILHYWKDKRSAILGARREMLRLGKLKEYSSFKALLMGKSPNPLKKSSGMLKKRRNESAEAAAAAELLKRRAAAKRGIHFYARMLTVKEVARQFGADPKAVAKLIRKKKTNPSASSIRKTFAGRYDKDSTLAFPDGTPAGKLAKLGKLVLIQTEAGTIKPINGTAWLCADSKGKLHIGSVNKSKLFGGPAQNFGKVSKVEYQESKPHLGYPSQTIWFHKMGEESGQKPSLYADGKGGLCFKGGAYRITERGIEN